MRIASIAVLDSSTGHRGRLTFPGGTSSQQAVRCLCAQIPAVPSSQLHGHWPSGGCCAPCCCCCSCCCGTANRLPLKPSFFSRPSASSSVCRSCIAWWWDARAGSQGQGRGLQRLLQRLECCHAAAGHTLAPD